MRSEVAERLGQQLKAPIQPPVHRRCRDAEHLGGLGLRQPLDPHQVERLPLSLRQVGDRGEHAAGARREPGVAAGRGGHQPVSKLHGGRLLI